MFALYIKSIVDSTEIKLENSLERRIIAQKSLNGCFGAGEA